MSNQAKIRTVIIGYGQRGADPYGVTVKEYAGSIELVAIADSDPVRLDLARTQFGDAVRYFSTGEAFFDEPRCADLVIISTQDKKHYSLVITALQKGYHVLVEKPISPDPLECDDIAKQAEIHDRKVFVSHVLRYTPFYTMIKEAILSGSIGEVVSVQQTENVEYWHQAHSYVRGNWRSKEESAPMILAKSCHDLDIILWLIDKKCERISSFGSLYLFTEKNAPAGSALRCIDCKAAERCPYDATEIYINGRFGYRSGYRGWPLSVLTDRLEDDQAILKAVAVGPYGRCVYHCDNDVVDHQVVNMEFEDGVTASFTMCAFTSTGGRTIKIMGTLGDIIADMAANTITVQPFRGEKKFIDIGSLGLDLSGHAGGDKRLIMDVVDILQNPGNPKIGLTSIDYSVQSHRMAFAAEESRLNGGVPVRI